MKRLSLALLGLLALISPALPQAMRIDQFPAASTPYNDGDYLLGWQVNAVKNFTIANLNKRAVGSCATPPYSFATSTNTGLCAPAVGSTALYTAGLEALRAYSNQQVSVGGAPQAQSVIGLQALGGVGAYSTSSPLLQLYNTGGGSDQKYLRLRGTTGGSLVFEKVNDAYNAQTTLGQVLTSGQWQFPNGTDGAPSISFLSGPNTGLRYDGANGINFSTNGVLAANIDNNGVTAFWGVLYLTRHSGIFSGININKISGAANSESFICGLTNDQYRMCMDFASGEVESGANSGSNFNIQRYADDGSFIDYPLEVNRATGLTNISDGLWLYGAFTNPGSNAQMEWGNPLAANTPFIDFHSSGNNIDHDVRLIASGGSASNGQGFLSIKAQSFGIDSSATPAALVILNNTNASASRRTSISWQKNSVNLWEMGPDVGASGGQDFYIYDVVNASTKLSITTTQLTTNDDIIISKNTPIFTMGASASGQNRLIGFQTGANLRWVIVGGDSTAEGGGNAGSNFAINRYNDAGTYLDTPVNLTRSTGIWNFQTGAPTISTSPFLDFLLGTTRGSVPYRGSGAWAALSPGTSGFVLTSNGAGADPSYQAASVSVPRLAKTANYTVVSGDRGNVVEVSNGPWTLTLTAPATVGSGFWFIVKNNSTTEVTISPASGTIDGVASFIVYPYETRLVQSDGSNYFSVILHGGYQYYTANGTFTKPPGVSRFNAAGCGGGGSGGGGANSANQQGASGGGGGYCDTRTFSNADMGATAAVVVPAAAAGVASGASGNNGGNVTLALTSITWTWYGGGGGKVANFASGCTFGGSGGTMLQAGAVMANNITAFTAALGGDVFTAANANTQHSGMMRWNDRNAGTNGSATAAPYSLAILGQQAGNGGLGAISNLGGVCNPGVTAAQNGGSSAYGGSGGGGGGLSNTAQYNISGAGGASIGCAGGAAGAAATGGTSGNGTNGGTNAVLGAPGCGGGGGGGNTTGTAGNGGSGATGGGGGGAAGANSGAGTVGTSGAGGLGSLLIWW